MVHYAFSEALIVLAGLWAAYRLATHHRFAAMLGVLVFVLAAAIGAVRYGLNGGLVTDLAPIHQFVSAVGGSAAMMALVYDLIDRRADAPIWRPRYLAVALVAMTLIVLFRPLAVPVFLIWSLAFIALVIGMPHRPEVPRWRAGMMAGLMLIAVLVFRQASWLSPAQSWHAFHILVAVWVFGLGYSLTMQPRATP